MAAFLGGFGVCIGGLVRNQIVAIVGLLILSFALEPTVLAVASNIGQFGPTSGAPNGLLGVNAFGEDEEQLAPALAVLVMIGWVGIVFAAAAARLERRDLV